MKNNFSFCLLFMVALGCKKTTNTSDIGSIVIDNAIEFSVVDVNGNDLLNPQSENAVKQAEIRVFYLINGQLREVYDSAKDYPRNFLIYQDENRYRLRLFLNSQNTEKASETIIQWSESDKDTIKAEFSRGKARLTVQKVWINGETAWSDDEGKELHFTVLKQ